jgi:2-phosphosulfolactate phosphatase
VTFDQSGFDVRCEWGEEGMRQLARCCPVVTVVDVLSFTTAVEVAVGNGAVVYPFLWNDGTAAEFDVSAVCPVLDDGAFRQLG